jgi:transcriptional regulator with XRE-family HTH domain
MPTPCIGSIKARAIAQSADGQGLRLHNRRPGRDRDRARRSLGDEGTITQGLLLKAEMGKRSCDPRDAEIAKRVRALRLQRGLSQSELGEVLGVTFQQVQKYERGTNRISAGRLYRIADLLDVPVSFFYEGYDGRGGDPGLQSIGVEFGFLQTNGAVRLARAYSRIAHGGVRQKLLLLAESLAGE